MIKKLGFLLSSLILFSQSTFADPGTLFSIVAGGSTLQISPTVDRYYPSMGIKLDSNTSLSGCTTSSNGYCIFPAGKGSPRTITLGGPTNNVSGTVCLNGPGRASCERFSFASSLCNNMNKVCRVFISSQEYDGNLGGTSGGDQKCQALANAANLGGTWKAWLSTSSIDASVNINYADDITYALAATGATIANPGNLLKTGTPDFIDLLSTINIDENGAVDNFFNAWTGTRSDGTQDSTNCQGWTVNVAAQTGLVGDPGFANFQWTGNNIPNCSTTEKIYCFESTQ